MVFLLAHTGVSRTNFMARRIFSFHRHRPREGVEIRTSGAGRRSEKRKSIFPKLSVPFRRIGRTPLLVSNGARSRRTVKAQKGGPTTPCCAVHDGWAADWQPLDGNATLAKRRLAE